MQIPGFATVVFLLLALSSKVGLQQLEITVCRVVLVGLLPSRTLQLPVWPSNRLAQILTLVDPSG